MKNNCWAIIGNGVSQNSGGDGLDAKKYAGTISAFTSDSGRFYCDVAHGFGASYNYYISDVQREVSGVWYDANVGKQIEPQSNTVLRFWFDTEPESVKISLIGIGE